MRREGGASSVTLGAIPAEYERGVVEVGWWCVGAVEDGTQLVKSMLSAKVEPVGQSWACGAGEEETGVGAEGEGDDVVGTIFLSIVPFRVRVSTQ